MQDEHDIDSLARLREKPGPPGAKRLGSRLTSVELTWEKTVLGLAAVLIACAVIGSAVVLTRNGGASSSGDKRQLASGALLVTRTPLRATATPTALATTAPVVLADHTPDRTECDSIRGTNYRSEAERQYYIAQCVTLEPEQSSRSGSSSSPTEVQPAPSVPPAVEPTESPPAPFGASDAIVAASNWISNQGSYTTESASCNAVQIGSHWVVTCQASLAGCATGSVCETRVSVCVYEDPVVVRASDQC